MSSSGRRSGSLIDTLPDELIELILTIQRYGSLRRYILAVFVSAVIGLWSGVLGAFESVLSVVAYMPRLIFNQVAGVSAPFWQLLGWVEGFQTTIESAAASAGLAGPLVAIVAWLVPVVLVIGILNVIVGFAETYLPLSAIPILGRWF
jgi:hypothetical protein